MLAEAAKVIRGLSADGVQTAESGHPGLPLGCAEIGAVLYGEVMKHNPENPDWTDRDRFVLSAGHGSMLIYSLLHLSDYDLAMEDLKNFRQLGYKTPGHPEYEDVPGVETTTGPLGQGFANAVGMAVSERMLAERYNTEKFEIIDHYTYTLLGDGCMMEGITSEAASLAGHLGLGKLVAIYDDNQISIEGSTDITFTESVPNRFKAYNWHVIDDVDGHDITAVKEAIAEAKEVTDKPTLIVAKTDIAKGAPNKVGTSAAHGAPLGEDEIKGMKEAIGLPVDEKFYVSDEVREYFAQRKKELVAKAEKWQEKFEQWAKANPELKEKWDAGLNLELPANLDELVNALEIDTPLSTRKASGASLREIADNLPYLVGGSADLAPSTKTYLDKYGEIQAGEYEGRNFRFGVREHAMAAMVNGISLHGGLRPFCATFLVFSDYMKSAMRMAALMEQPVVYVLTHDSLYIGEDGPTHQPIEHVETLRLIPNLKVLRPADAEETKQAWLQALENTDGPTALVLTRQDLPALDTDMAGIDKGGYALESKADLDIALMASGSEVSLAVEVAELLEDKGYTAQVASIPDRELFAEQKQDYINQVIGDNDTFRVAIEAGVGQGWYQLLGTKHHLVSMESFGASGPGEEVGLKFGFEAEKIANDIIEKL